VVKTIFPILNPNIENGRKVKCYLQQS
jgi:hypothetical protein